MRVAGNIPVRVEKIVQETAYVKRFRLVSIDGFLLPSFRGGAHIKTFIEGQNDVLERSYSLISPPTERNYYEIAIRKDEQSRGGSRYWHEQVHVGDTLEISFPRNHFSPSFLAKHHVLYAAGIGITPFLTIIQDLEDWQTFELHYTARTPEECAFYELLKTEYGDYCTFYFTRMEEPNRMTPDIMQQHRVGSHVYFCGPIEMVKEYREVAGSYGYPEHSIHFEIFSNSTDNAKQRKPFTVELTESNKTLYVSEEDTLLDTLLKAGIDAPHACKIGGCGSCELEVAEGEVDHRDFFLKDEDRVKRKAILPCCSRAKSDRIAIKI
ncbi:PDR/VanB family oxidoreductase [Solibacillus sp. FSL H8-0538]|uniref:PDR/VanB family oxidoreductase n=1 Tax=Solibacillus sp. FSL H8-0538 TaxID=2921400 RepID=UPI0030FC7F52